MLVSNTNYQVSGKQQTTSSYTASDAPGSEFSAALTNASTSGDVFNVTAAEIRNGFFGDSLARVHAAMDAGYSVNSLSLLTSSDIDLIQKTTGVIVKDGGYYDDAGNRIGMHYDANGNPTDVPAGLDFKGAFDLAQTLSDMRLGGPEGDVGLWQGATIRVKDLETFVADYAAARTNGQDVYQPDTEVIARAEAAIRAENGV